MDAEHLIFPAARGLDRDDDHSLGELEGQVQALRQTRPDALADHQPVDDGLHVVDLVLGKLRGLIGDFDGLAVDPRPDQPRAADRLEHLRVVPLSPSNQGREQDHFPSLGKAQHVGDHLFRRLAMDRQAAFRAERRAQPGEEQTQIIVDLGDRADRTPRACLSRLLVDGHRRR